jgi:hypothetical protein
MAQDKKSNLGGKSAAIVAADKNSPAVVSVAANSTVYKNAPIEGGETEVVLNNIIIRSPVRQEVHIDKYMSALKAAEMRHFPNRTALYDIYFQILLDGYLFGIIQKRILSVLNQKLYYTDPEDEEVEGMKAFTRSDELRIIQRTILETIMWGISGLEFLPGNTLRLRIIPRKHIHPKTQMISIEQSDQSNGYDYTKLDNVWVIGEDEDLGLLRQCAINVIYKRGAMADWSNFIEIFGMPIRVVKYDPLDVKTEATLSEKLEDSGNMTAMMIPNTAQFEIIDGKTANASGDLQDKFIKFFNDENAIVVLGNTETTGNSGTGSQAKSKTHSDQQKEIAKADIEYLENKLNDPHFIKILKSYGLPVVDGGRFKIKSSIDINYAVQKSQIDATLSEAGLDIGEDYLRDTYDIPKPGPGEKVIKLTKPQTPPNLSDVEAMHIKMASFQERQQVKDNFDLLLSEMAKMINANNAQLKDDIKGDLKDFFA